MLVHQRSMPSSQWLLLIVLALMVLAAAPAAASCCRLMRIDAETAGAPLRVCDPDAGGGCGTVLFEGTLALGATHSVCSTAQTIVYSEYDTTLSAFGPPTTAVCTGGDVEL